MLKKEILLNTWESIQGKSLLDVQNTRNALLKKEILLNTCEFTIREKIEMKNPNKTSRTYKS